MNREHMVRLLSLLNYSFAKPPCIRWVTVAFFCALWISLYALRSSWTVEDTILASTLIPNVMQGHGVDLTVIPWGIDLGRPEDLSFVKDATGRILPVHPIGMLVLSAPIQVLLWVAAWISGFPLDVTNPDFLPTRLAIEKLSACFLVSLTVLYLFRALSLCISPRLSLVIAALYAFGSSSLSMLSQGLWPHTGINLILMYLSYFFLRQDARPTRGREHLFFLALGLLCSIRPTAIPLAGLFGALFLRIFGPPRVTSILTVALALLPTIVWNVALFHHVLGGYIHFAHRRFEMDVSRCLSRLWLILFFPQRGFLTFNPFIVFAVWAYTPMSALPDRRRLVLFTIVAVVFSHYLLCSTNPEWHGGYTFGPRYMLDVLAPTFLLAGIGFNFAHSLAPRVANFTLISLMLLSVSLHVFGALGDRLPPVWLRGVYRQLLIPS